MTRPVMFRLLFLGMMLIFVSGQAPVTPERPKAIAVAETKLLMEALCQPNFRGLEKLLRGASIEGEGWIYARGQALLLAETGNLLMLRPPRSGGLDTWTKLSVELRERSTLMAKHLAAKDMIQSRSALVTVSATCNQCHRSFRIPVAIRPFEAETK